MRKVSPPLSRHPFLRELQLNSNNFGDDGGEILFSSLVKGPNLIENISLDRCNFVTCRWAKHLPNLDSLHTLSLSYNNINDVGLQELCRHVECCFNMRSLSLASNAFGEKSMCLGSLLQNHPGILDLNLSGNMLQVESIDAVAFGIVQNRSLLNLNMSACMLSAENANKICKSLLTNMLMVVDLTQNPIDSHIQANARQYASQNLNIFDGNAFSSGRDLA